MNQIRLTTPTSADMLSLLHHTINRAVLQTKKKRPFLFTSSKMAPKRTQTNANGFAAADTGRVTRSSTRRGNATVSQPAEQPKRKKTKTTTSPDSSKTIIIEHCKQCKSFMTRAIQVKNGLEKDIVGLNVVVNPEKPRRGCFEIREKGGEIFVSLLDMKRPFKLMKALDMDTVISEIVEKIK